MSCKYLVQIYRKQIVLSEFFQNIVMYIKVKGATVIIYELIFGDEGVFSESKAVSDLEMLKK